ncbi:tape measure protein [Shinella daejeonensis]|uniref:tape measure protein n=1 Tax=Shinella daejeonensis TaxID=659017 RepID=UPI0020C7CB4B|nr:tape measure protein [Shinella daejeonensis]MCP8894302.1 tape measure protein [Shinella daejeonensis]
MATDLEKLVVQLSADIRGFDKELARMNGVSNRQFNAIERRARQMNKNLDGIFARSFKGLVAPLAGVGAVLGTAELARLADTWSDLNSRVRLAAGGVEQGNAVMERVGEVARRTYSSLEQTAEGYLANATTLKELGYTTSQTLDFTESLNNALVVSGAKGQRAESVMNALSKAMALGKLSGENLNTVISQGGRVAEALAEGLGVGVNQLRALGTAGKITGRDVVQALSSQMEKLRKEAAEMPGTISDGIQLLQNAMLQYVGNADQATGVSQEIAEALEMMADNFDKTADVALQLAAVIAGALIGRSLTGMIKTLGLAGTALANFTRALVAARTVGGLTAAFGGLGAAAGPVGMVIGGAVVSSLILFSNTTASAGEGAKRFADRLRELEKAAEDAGDQVENAANRFSAEKLNALTNEVKAAEVELISAKEAVEALFASLFTNADLSIVPDAQIDELRQLKRSLDDGTISAEEAKNRLFALANLNPNFQALANTFQPVLDNLTRVSQGARDAAAELAALSTGRLQGAYQQYADSRIAGNAIEADRNAYVDEALRRAKLGKDQLALENEIASVRRASLADGKKLTEDQIKRIADANLAGNASRTAEGKKPKKERDDEYERLTKSIQERTAAIIAETAAQRTIDPLIDDYGFTLARAQAAQDLLTAAQKAGTAAGKELKDVQQLLAGDFENLSPAAREQARAILEMASSYGTAIEASERFAEKQDEIRQRAEDALSTAKDVTRGVVDGFIEGADAADIFANSLKKIGSALIDDVLNNIFKVNNAVGGGGWLSGIFGLFGGGGSFPAAPTGGLYANGGYTGPGGKNQPAGIVHKGEVVFSQADVARMGGVAAVEALRRGYANGGPVGIRAPVMPRMRAAAGDTIVVNFQPTINAPNADAAGLAEVRHDLAVMKKEMPARAVAAIQDARRRNVKGL